MNVNNVLPHLHKELLHGMYFDYDDTSTKFLDIITITTSLFLFEPEIKKGQKDLSITIPVFHYSVWEKEKAAAEAFFSWMTDTHVSLQFTNNIPPDTEEGFLLSLPAYQNIALFYDDIESIAGINHQLVCDYIRIPNKNNEKTKQQKLAAFLRKTASDSSEIINIDIKLLNKRKSKTTPAAISLVLAIAAAKAYFNGGTKVYYYQSQKIDADSLNLAKTAHPKTYQLLNALYQCISADMQIETPLLHKTRVAILKEMPKEHKLQIKNTNECLRMKRKTALAAANTPCGICTACFQRKIALAAANSEVYDGFYQYDYGQKIAEITDEHDQQIYRDTLELMETLSQERKTTEEDEYLADDLRSAFACFVDRYNPY
ncbi:7-cyano-7-deazaguanine synthase [Paenibacillus alvei]